MPFDSQESRVVKRLARHRLHRNICAAVVLTMAVLASTFSSTTPQPMRTSSLSGRRYMNEVLSCKNPRRFLEIFRMKIEVFHFLCSELQSKGGLISSRYIALDEKVGMFLWTIAHEASNRAVQERFQHSGDTVSRYFHQVLQAINHLISKYIKLPTLMCEIPVAITSNPTFYNFFNDYIGALYCTHIAARLPAERAAPSRSRKG